MADLRRAESGRAFAVGSKVLLLVAALGVLIWRAQALVAAVGIPANDWLEYWGAGRLFLTGQNPYDPDALFALQKPLGWPFPEPVMMYNPPWIFPFLLPWASLPYALGWFVWSAVLLLGVAWSAAWIWRMYGGGVRFERAWLWAFTFLPAYFALAEGQIGPWLLVGLVGFLLLWRRGWAFRAGMCLGVLAWKPQVAYLVWVALALWSWEQRHWRVLAGAGTMLALSLAVTLALRPDMLPAYGVMLRVADPTAWATPVLGNLLRLTLGPDQARWSFVPAGLGTVALLVLWPRWRATWTWETALPWLLLFSLWTAPHAWTFDQVLAVTALLPAVLTVQRLPRRRWVPYLAGYGAVQGLGLVLQVLRLPDFFYFWQAPAYLVLYALVQAEGRRWRA